MLIQILFLNFIKIIIIYHYLIDFIVIIIINHIIIIFLMILLIILIIIQILFLNFIKIIIIYHYLIDLIVIIIINHDIIIFQMILLIIKILNCKFHCNYYHLSLFYHVFNDFIDCLTFFSQNNVIIWMKYCQLDAIGLGNTASNNNRPTDWKDQVLEKHIDYIAHHHRDRCIRSSASGVLPNPGGPSLSLSLFLRQTAVGSHKSTCGVQ